jgi:hypothetical protein
MNYHSEFTQKPKALISPSPPSFLENTHKEVTKRPMYPFTILALLA